MTNDESFWRALLELNVTNITREVGYDVEGTVPTQIGILSTLQTLDLTVVQGASSSRRGRSLLTGGTGLSGTLPTQIGLLRSLSIVRFGPMAGDEGCGSSNALTGTVPLELARLPSLAELDLRCNRLIYPDSIAVPGFQAYESMQVCVPTSHLPPPTSHVPCPTSVLPASFLLSSHLLLDRARVAVIAAQARCDALGNLCQGFPPESCLAFDAVPSLTDVRMCTPCEDMPFGLLVFLVTSQVLGLVSLLAIYITLMLRHPQALKR